MLIVRAAEAVLSASILVGIIRQHVITGSGPRICYIGTGSGKRLMKSDPPDYRIAISRGKHMGEKTKPCGTPISIEVSSSDLRKANLKKFVS